MKCIFFAVCLTFPMVALTAEFEPPVRLEAGGQIIQTDESSAWAAPCLFDLDNDGEKDLLMGVFGGRIKVYPGEGKGVFGAGEWLKTTGVVVKIPGCSCDTPATPLVIDLNEDGYADLLSGSLSGNGAWDSAGLLHVLWGKKEGGFEPATILNGSDGSPLVVKALDEEGRRSPRTRTRPAAIDWDADGDLDLVVGNSAGSFYLFRGEGQGKYSPQSELLNDDAGNPLMVKGEHSDPFFADLDADGDLDLLSGSEAGEVSWAKNTAGKDKTPQLMSFQKLVNVVPGREAGWWSHESLPGPAKWTRVSASDLNHDGKLDLIVGDNRRDYLSPKTGVTLEEAKKHFQVGDKEMREIYAALDNTEDESEEKILRKRFRASQKTFQKHVNSQIIGFVWVYYQK